MAEFFAVFDRQHRGGMESAVRQSADAGKTLEQAKTVAWVKLEAATEAAAKTTIYQLYPNQLSQPLLLIEASNVKEP